MSKLYYDLPKTSEMDNFLKYIYTIFSQNDLSGYSKDEKKSIICYELRKYGLKPQDLGPNREMINNEYLFTYWLDKNKNSGYKDAFVDSKSNYFIQFVDNKGRTFDRNFIKLYIPVDGNHLYQGVNELFDFIRNQGIRHISKVAQEKRSDNITVRLDAADEESAQKIIEFVNSNPILKEGLNKTNPFVPTVDGVGYMYETGISYNSQMSLLIEEYIEYCLNSNSIANINQFCKWIVNNNRFGEVERIFFSALGFDIPSEKKTFNIELFNDALKATYLKYGIEQAIQAIISTITDNDYTYFTNGTMDTRYRDKLMNAIEPKQIEEYIDSVLQYKNINIDLPLEDKAKTFCYDLLQNLTQESMYENEMHKSIA